MVDFGLFMKKQIFTKLVPRHHIENSRVLKKKKIRGVLSLSKFMFVFFLGEINFSGEKFVQIYFPFDGLDN